MAGEVNVMAMQGFEFQDITSSTTVPNDPVARLMYYLHCVLTTVDEADSNANTRRLSDYKNYQLLTKDEVMALMLVCVALNPISLEGKIFFKISDLESGNRFVRITDSRVVIAAQTIDLPDEAANGIFVGAHREIQEVMLYSPSWMERNYLEPLTNLSSGGLETRFNRRPPAGVSYTPSAGGAVTFHSRPSTPTPSTRTHHPTNAEIWLIVCCCIFCFPLGAIFCCVFCCCSDDE